MAHFYADEYDRGQKAKLMMRCTLRMNLDQDNGPGSKSNQNKSFPSIYYL